MKVNGVEIEVVNELRGEIQSNFGSLFSFANHSGFSYSVLKRTFNDLEFTQLDIDNIQSSYNKHLDPEDIPFRISDVDREAIRVCIVLKFKNVKKFTDKHPEYNSVYISNVINGRLKLESIKYVNFISLLKKKYNLQIK